MSFPLPHGAQTIRTSPLLLGTTVAIIMLCAVAIGAATGVIPGIGAKAAYEPVALPAPTDVQGPGQCASCGTVVAVRTFELRGDLSALHAAASAAPGSIALEHAKSAKPGTTAPEGFLPAQLASQLAAQFSFDRTPKKRYVYRVTLRMEDGSYRTVSLGAAPQFSPGDRVRLVQGALAARLPDAQPSVQR